MTPIIASLYSCALRKPLLAARNKISGKFTWVLLGIFVSVPAFAGGADISADEVYSDDITVTAFNGEPLDINGDGNVDLAIAVNESIETSRYYLGNGDGTFGDPILLAINASSEIVAADFNEDTFIDLLQGVRDNPSRLYLGDGAGNLGSPMSVLDTDRVLAVAVGDLDDDGDLDLVTGTGHPGGEPSTPDNLAPNRFYLNNIIGTGEMSFAGEEIAPDMDDTRAIELADMDGDGDLDVIAGNDETTAGSNRVYLNQFVESGTNKVSFGPGIDFGPEDDQTSRILIGHLNDDDQPDIVVLNFIASAGTAGVGSPGINRFFINETAANGAFTLSAPTDISADADMSSGGALADFDGDGDLDVAVANIVNGPGEPRNRLYLNQFVENGDGTVSFGAGMDISADEHQSRELAAGDINGDGHIDIVVANQPLPGNVDPDPVPGRDRRYLNNGNPEAPFTNVAPVIDSQAVALETAVDTALTLELEQLTVTDPDNVYPDDFTLTVESGTDYTVDSAANAITPAAGFSGNLAVPVTVNDGTDASAAFELCINVGGAGDCNNPPEFTSDPVTDATAGTVYTYNITATDEDGEALTITAPTLPAWLALTDNGDGTATLTGTPAEGDVGSHDVSLQASDGSATVTQPFSIAVTAGTDGGENAAPEFTSTAVTGATEGEEYTYEVTTSDADGDDITITAPTLPDWLTLTDNGDGTATLSGTPGADDVGDHDVSLQASDGTEPVTQDFTVTVEAAGGGGGGNGGGDSGGDSGGGGSLGTLSLLALLGLAVAGRRRKA